MTESRSAAGIDVSSTLGIEPGGPRSRRRWLRWLVVLAIVAGAVWLFVRAQESASPVYVTDSAQRGSLRVTVTATGTLQPTNQVDVGSEVSGLIAEVFVDYNARVKAGDPLARLDTDTLEARFASAQASLAVAEASLSQAQATVAEVEAQLNRTRELAERNLVSRQNLETDEAAALRARAAVESARAQVTASRASLREAQTSLSKAVIRAPIDGMVIAREVDPGQTVAASFQTPLLFRLAEDLGRMRLHLDLDESDVGQVREGQTAEFRVDAYPGRTFSAQIVSVRFNPRTVNNVVTYETVLSVDNPSLLLRPGMTATAEIIVEERPDALLVPNRALRFLPPFAEREGAARATEQGARVWLLRDGQAQAVPLVTGVTDGQFTEVLEGDINVDSVLIVDIERTPRQQGGGGPFG
jgi:HlyD family secretion protein